MDSEKKLSGKKPEINTTTSYKSMLNSRNKIMSHSKTNRNRNASENIGML